MIHIFTVTAPLGERDAQAVTASLTQAMDKLVQLHPALREASAQAADGILTMTLRVSASDRWRTSGAARKIASSLLQRVMIPARTAEMKLTAVPPSATSLTREQGRSVTHTPRRKRLPIESQLASEDPIQ